MPKSENSNAQISLFPEDDRIEQENGLDSAKEIMTREGLTFLYIDDPEQAAQTVTKLMDQEFPLGLDTETAKLPDYMDHKQAGLEPHLSSIRLVQVYGGADEVYLFDAPAFNIGTLSPLWKKTLVAHNAVFDIKHLLHAGADPLRVGCTMLMANALTGKLLSLAALAREHLGWNMSKAQRTSDWNTEKLSEDQLAYSALDAVAVFRLQRRLKEQLVENNLVRTYTLMRDAQRAVAEMELNGIYFDVQGHERLMARWQKTKKEAQEDLVEIIGPRINPDSSKQISAWLQAHLDDTVLANWPKTKSGQLRTDSGTLNRHPSPIAEPFLSYKDASKKLSTFGTGYVEHVNPETGRIHASFRIGGTSTGRLSCSSPNIQNPPRDKSFRELFSAPHGRMLVVADYGQIELRVAALVSRDANMLEAYAKGQDLHRTTAAAIAGVPLEEVTQEQRQAAKAVNFGLLYGQGPRGLARYARTNYGVKMSEKDAQEARDAFFRAYSGLRNWQVETGRQAERSNRVVTPGGRIRDFAKEKRGYQYTEALNTPIQGGAAEVMLATLAKLEKHLEALDARLVNVIHDEIVLEVAGKDTDRAKDAVEKAMVEGMLAVFPSASTVCLVEAKAGSNLAETK